ncbi:DNA-directed RNA polymerase sigma-70 factor [Parapedobacter pyrenivorans]|uniref:DNA-directed RNA polymerase sigma-70 factor n=2 Tax=Parapedobacter pyrenivorans TaxID=1305674 RepID=A0A917HQT8_9SPHI|nr:DNA-directed RNA polymerase sigma-70 factor [Parapedobacter pyrenivorans]
MLYDAHWERLFRYVVRILPDEDDVADVVQETFILFWESDFDAREFNSVEAYLLVIARNLAFKRFREQLKRTQFEQRLMDHFGGGNSDMLMDIHTKELSQLIDAEVDKLPERMREVFTLSRKEHLSYKEIAERLNISDETVKKQISKSLRHLRLKLNEEYITYLIILAISDNFC